MGTAFDWRRGLPRSEPGGTDGRDDHHHSTVRGRDRILSAIHRGIVQREQSWGARLLGASAIGHENGEVPELQTRKPSVTRAA
jgi:hypothetical protein